MQEALGSTYVAEASEEWGGNSVQITYLLGFGWNLATALHLPLGPSDFGGCAASLLLIVIRVAGPLVFEIR